MPWYIEQQPGTGLAPDDDIFAPPQQAPNQALPLGGNAPAAPAQQGAIPTGQKSRFVTTKVKPPERSWGEAGRDTALGIVAGVADTVQGVGALYGLATGNMDNSFTKWTREEAGLVADAMRDGYSEELKAEIQNQREAIREADNWVSKAWTGVKTTLSNPSLAANFAAEMAGGLGAMGAGAKVTGKVAGKVAGGSTKAQAAGATAGGVGTGVGLQAGDVGGQAYEDLMNTSQEYWALNAEYTRLIAEGKSDSEARNQIATDLAQNTALEAGAISLAVNSIPAFRMVEKALGGAKQAGGIAGRAKNTAKGAATEGAEEWIEEAGGQFASNINVNDVNTSIDDLEGVGDAGALGLAGGMVVGAGVGALQRAEKTPDENTEEDLTPQEEDALAGEQAAEEGAINFDRPTYQRQGVDPFAPKPTPNLPATVEGEGVRGRERRTNQTAMPETPGVIEQGRDPAALALPSPQPAEPSVIALPPSTVSIKAPNGATFDIPMDGRTGEEFAADGPIATELPKWVNQALIDSTTNAFDPSASFTVTDANGQVQQIPAASIRQWLDENLGASTRPVEPETQPQGDQALSLVPDGDLPAGDTRTTAVPNPTGPAASQAPNGALDYTDNNMTVLPAGNDLSSIPLPAPAPEAAAPMGAMPGIDFQAEQPAQPDPNVAMLPPPAEAQQTPTATGAIPNEEQNENAAASGEGRQPVNEAIPSEEPLQENLGGPRSEPVAGQAQGNVSDQNPQVGENDNAVPELNDAAQGETPAPAPTGTVRIVKNNHTQVAAASQNLPEQAAGIPLYEGKAKAKETLTTQQGVETDPFPALNFGTGASARNAMKKVDKWLVDQVQKLRDQRRWPSDVMETAFRDLNPKKLTSADREGIITMLFGDALYDPSANETPPDDPGPGGGQSPEVSPNRIVSEERYRAARERMIARRNGTLNSGIDPQDLLDAIEMTVYHIERGARTFAAYAKAMHDDFGPEMYEQMKSSLRQWYNAARDDQRSEDEGLSATMDNYESVNAAHQRIRDGETIWETETQAEPETQTEFDPDAELNEDQRSAVRDAITTRFEEVTDNRSLSKVVADALGVKPKDIAFPAKKYGQEAYEAEMVMIAREVLKDDINRQNRMNDIDYAAMVDMYQSMPNLNIRSEDSMGRQAYSTPAPLAYLTHYFAGLDQGGRVLENSAGNGMLVAGVPADRVVANELDPIRAEALQDQGLMVNVGDALTFEPGDVQRYVANPPFGKISEPFGMDGTTFNTIDHAIVAKGLSALPDDGSAAVIIGANKEPGESSAADRTFFEWLYQNYYVVDHLEVDGKLYTKQGASWPVRVIAVRGRRPEPNKDIIGPRPSSIQRYDNWNDLYGRTARSLGALADEGAERRSSEIAQFIDKDAADRINSLLNSGKGQSDAQPDAGGRGGRGGRGGVSVRSGDTTTTQRDAPRPERSGSDDNGKRGSDNAGVLDRPVEKSTTADSSGRTQSESKPDAGNNRDTELSVVTDEGTLQVPYTSFSSRKDKEVLIPVNMKKPMEEFFERLQKDVGDIDNFVMDRLGYDSKEDLHNAFMGLQVDSIAAAIYNFERPDAPPGGYAVIIADQTGIGKGRQAAGMIRYHLRQGRTPVFVTLKPKLFTDMYEDMINIGMTPTEIQPLIVNSDVSIKLKRKGGGYDVPHAAGTSKKTSPRNKELARTGKLPADNNMVMMSYSQINNDKTGVKRRMLMKLRENSNVAFVLDEAHNIGGPVEAGSTKNPRQTGSGFMRQLVKGKPVTYLSATYAKRPDNMPAFEQTMLGEIAAGLPEDVTLDSVIQSGGAPLQSKMAEELVRNGQLIRRERSFAGINVEAVVDTANEATHRELADKVIVGLRAVATADKAFHNTFFANISNDIKAANAHIKAAGNRASANHSPFTSVLSNYVDQLLLALKADTVIDQAVEVIQNGGKPVVTLVNTMGAFMEDMGTVGAPLDMDFRDVLLRALERTRRISHKANANADPVVQQVDLTDLDPATLAAYEAAEDIINDLELGGLPLSPIDYIIQGIEKRGYSMGEVTGRGLYLDYSESPPVLRSRTGRDDQKTVDDFQQDTTHGILFNSAGATGISMHNDKNLKPSAQKQRVMLMAQVSNDITDMMQALGRINRTNQRTEPHLLPAYRFLNTALPMEKRPLAKTMSKLASLNANTSANTEGNSTVKAVDFLNRYGDLAVARYISQNPDVVENLFGGISVYEGADDMGYAEPDYALKVSGRVGSFLTTEQQDDFYEQVEVMYQDIIDYQNSIGENVLVAADLNLQAGILESNLFHEGKEGEQNTAISGNAIAHTIESNVQRKPPRWDEVEADLRKTRKDAGLADGDNDIATARIKAMMSDEEAARILDVTRNGVAGMVESDSDLSGPFLSKVRDADSAALLTEVVKNILSYQSRHKATELEMKPFEDYERSQGLRMVAARDKALEELADQPRLGDMVEIPVTAGEDAFSLFGVVTDLRLNPKLSPSTFLPGAMRFSIAVASPMRRFNVPFSKMKKGAVNGVNLEEGETTQSVFEEQAKSGNNDREQRVMITGNLAAAIAKKPGQIVTFSADDGQRYSGLLVPAHYTRQFSDTAEAGMFEPKVELAAAQTFLGSDLTELKTGAGAATLVKDAERGIILRVQKGGKVGAKLRERVTPDMRRGQFYTQPSRSWYEAPLANVEAIAKTIGFMQGADPFRLPETERDLYIRFGGTPKNGKGQFNSPLLEQTGTVRSRAGKPGGPGIAREALDRIASGVSAAIPINIVESTADLPGDHPADTAGLYTGDAVYLVRSNIADPLHARTVLAHELAGHHGIESIPGVNFSDIREQLERLEASGNRAVVEAAAIVDQTEPGASPELRAREIMARLAERRVTEPRVAAILRRVREAVRKWLRTMGINGLMPQTEIDSIITEGFRLSMAAVARTQSDLLSRVPSDAPVIEVEGRPFGAEPNRDSEKRKQMRQRAIEYSRRHFAGKTFTNENTGQGIYVGMKGIRHTAHTAATDLLRSLRKLDELLEKAVLIESQSDKLGDPQVKQVHYFAAKVRVDGAVKDTVVVVKEYADGVRYYDHSFERPARLTAPDFTTGSGRTGDPDTPNDAGDGPDDKGFRRSRNIPDELSKIKRLHGNKLSAIMSQITPKQRRQFRDAKKKIRTWGNRYFTKEGLLGDDAFASAIETEGMKNAGDHQVAGHVQWLNQALGNRYDKLSEADRELLNDYLGAEDAEARAAIAEANPKLFRKNVVRELDNMRAYLDRLSGKMIDAMDDVFKARYLKLKESTREKVDLYLATGGQEGYLPEALVTPMRTAATIADNLGTYLTRSYQAFSDADWINEVRDNEDLVQRAMSFFRENNLDRLAESTIGRTANDRGAKVAQVRAWLANDGEGNTDLLSDAQYERAITKLKEVLTETELRGQVFAVLEDAYESGNFTSLLASGQKYGSKDQSILTRRKEVPPIIRELLGEFKDARLNFANSATKMEWWLANHHFQKAVLDDGFNTFLFNEPQGEDYAAKVAGDKSTSLDLLAGLYTSREFKTGLEDRLNAKRAEGLARWAMKANSLIKYGKTILSPTTQARNFWSANFFALANGHWWFRPGAHEYMKKAWALVGNDIKPTGNRMADRALQAEMNELIREGVTHDNPFAGELKDAMRDVIGENSYGHGLAATGRRLAENLQRFYQGSDDFWKVVGYLYERDLLMKRGIEPEEARKMAARRIRDTYPTYSMVPEWVNMVRKWYLVGTFVSFPYESVRTTGNMIRYLADDVKNGRKGEAMSRFVGLTVAMAGATSVSQIMMSILGIDDDDDEAIRQQLPPWSRNSILVYTGYDDNGDLTYWDSSALDPYAYVKKPFQALVNGNNEDIESKIVDMGKEILTPFVGPEIAAGSIVQILTNSDEYGRQVYNPEDTVLRQFAQGARHFMDVVKPGVFNNLKEINSAISGEISDTGREYTLGGAGAAVAGIRLGTINTKRSMIFRGYDFRRGLTDSTRLLSSVVNSQADVSREDVIGAYRNMERARRATYNRMAKVVEGARKLGLNDDDIREALSAASVSKADIAALLAGDYRPWAMSRQFSQSFTRRAMAGAETIQKRARIQKQMAMRKALIQALIDAQPE